MKAEVDSPWYKFRNKCEELVTGTHPEDFLPKGAINPFWKQDNQWQIDNHHGILPKEEMNHEIEFYYDGCNNWAYNGGSIISAGLVRSYIGKEAFLEATKYYRDFRVRMKVSIEPIKGE